MDQPDRQDQDALRFNWELLATRLPKIPPQARLTREVPEDFCVEEEPAYPPSGSGEHVMVRVQKRGLSTLEVTRRLAAQLGANPRDVGFAGRKDVHAVATQWFSVPRRRNTPRLEPGPLGPGITVLEATLHKNKLQLGHLRGNRFVITLRSPVPGALETLQARLPQVARGVPNYFGPQRFGVGGVNAAEGLRVLQGQRRGGDPRGLQLLVSAVQSAVFNRVADARLRKDPDVMPWPGDILVKVPSGAPFWCEDPNVDGRRVADGSVAVTGPLPGSRGRTPKGDVLALEERVAREVLGDRGVLARGPRAPVGDRRAILVWPRQPTVEVCPQGLKVGLSLPPGCFATAVLREWAGISEEGSGPAEEATG